MKIQLNQGNQFQHFNSRFVSSAYKSHTDTSLHSRRRMLDSQEKAKETEAVRVTISGEAMQLSRQAKAMERQEKAIERWLQFTNDNVEETEETKAAEQDKESENPVQLTDEELYEELLNQVEIWGDKSYALLYKFNHEETARMAEQRAAALTEMRKLEEMQKSEISKQQREAQKAAETASMQQEEINKKSSELIMMLESFEDKDEEDEKDKAAEGGDSKDDDAKTTGSLMEGEFGAMAAKGEMGMLDTMNGMDKSSTYRIETSRHSLIAVETERRHIYQANEAENYTMKEKMEGMEYFVCMLANRKDVKDSFLARIEKETDPEAKKKLEAKMEYFDHLNMKNGYRDLKRDREFSLQERITARDLRIAHLGDRHFALAEQQKKELQSLFDEDDIMRTQGQDGITNRTEDVAERLQEKLDERDHIDEDTTPKEDVREKEELEKEELEKEELEKKELEKEELEKKELAKAESGQTLIRGSLNLKYTTDENKKG